MSSIAVAPIAEDLPYGATIRGVTWDNVKDATTQQQIRDVFEDRGMIVFKDVEASPEMQIALSDIFGPPQDHALKEQPRVDAVNKPGLVELNYKGNIVDAAGKPLVGWVPWHFDACYTAKLNRGGILRALIIAEEGGMTGFADGVQIYNDVRPELRDQFEDLRVIYHSGNMFSNQRFGVPDNFKWVSLADAAVNLLKSSESAPRATHPAIWTRATGEKVLHVSPWQAAGVEGLETPEGDALLQALCEEIYAKMKPYWHPWAPGDMVIWDNWRFIHSAGGNDPKYPRLMQRTTIKGDYDLGAFEHGAEGGEMAEMMM